MRAQASGHIPKSVKRLKKGGCDTHQTTGQCGCPNWKPHDDKLRNKIIELLREQNLKIEYRAKILANPYSNAWEAYVQLSYERGVASGLAKVLEVMEENND